MCHGAMEDWNTFIQNNVYSGESRPTNKQLFEH